MAGQGGGWRQGTEAQSCFKVPESDSHAPCMSMTSAPHFPSRDLNSHQLNVAAIALLKPHPPGSPMTSCSYGASPTLPASAAPAPGLNYPVLLSSSHNGMRNSWCCGPDPGALSFCEPCPQPPCPQPVSSLRLGTGSPLWEYAALCDPTPKAQTQTCWKFRLRTWTQPRVPTRSPARASHGRWWGHGHWACLLGTLSWGTHGAWRSEAGHPSQSSLGIPSARSCWALVGAALHTGGPGEERDGANGKPQRCLEMNPRFQIPRCQSHFTLPPMFINPDKGLKLPPHHQRAHTSLPHGPHPNPSSEDVW